MHTAGISGATRQVLLSKKVLPLLHLPPSSAQDGRQLGFQGPQKTGVLALGL